MPDRADAELLARESAVKTAEAVGDRVTPSSGSESIPSPHGENELSAAEPSADKHDSWSAEELSELIDRHEQSLLAYARRMLGGDWPGAQDAVQETFLRLCRERRSKIHARIQPWLFTVCRSRVIDMQRTKHSHPVDSAELSVVDPHPDAASAAMQAEQADSESSRLQGLVSKLSERQQEVLRLRIQAGLSYREIAEVTGLTVSNVGFHLHAAVRSLKDSVAATA